MWKKLSYPGQHQYVNTDLLSLRLVLHKQDHPSTLPYVTPLRARNGPVHLCGTLRHKDAALQGGNDHKAVCCAFAAGETIFSS